MLSQKNQSLPVVKAAKPDFTQELLAIGEKRPENRTGLNFKYTKEKWAFIAKEPGLGDGAWWVANY